MLGFEKLDIGEVIEKIKPDIIALGYDQLDMAKNVENYINKHKLNIKIVRVGKFGEDLDSSSKIKQKIIEKFNR